MQSPTVSLAEWVEQVTKYPNLFIMLVNRIHKDNYQSYYDSLPDPPQSPPPPQPISPILIVLCVLAVSIRCKALMRTLREHIIEKSCVP